MYKLDYKEYAKVAREVVANGCVLIKNDKETLPIKKEEKVSVFGRIQLETYISGTGSGGMVNYPYLVNVVEGIKAKRTINEDVLEIYKEYIEENPYDRGDGWAKEPWCQKDMELTEDIVKIAKSKSDVAVYVIGRSAGEDNDSTNEKGSYYLTDIEEKNIRFISKYFDKTVIMLNVGNIIDMEVMMDINPSAIIYTWHGGCESGNGYADVLCGDVNPSGCLPDTIPIKLEDNIATKNFGGEVENIYQEDIFVGYRYFETFAKERVLFPFGYGLSYTEFDLTGSSMKQVEDTYKIKTTVENIGSVKGKKTVQIYVEAPNGKLGKAKKVLVGFVKTKELQPKEKEVLEVVVKEKDIASYDDYYEKKSCFVIEKGTYQMHIGFDVEDVRKSLEFSYEEDRMIEQCNEALTPIKPFERYIAVEEDRKVVLSKQQTPKRSYDIADRITAERTEVKEKTNHGYLFTDIQAGKITVEEFVNDLEDIDLIHLTRGEGMSSPKVTAGTASAFGAVTDGLLARKIPIACCSDGPSGIRMDTGTMAFSLPNGTAIASTFDMEMTTKLFELLALELSLNKIDTILGPGINIHRSALCGRNFEYFSEDPFLSGKMTIAELKGLHKYGILGTIKHFAGNNQENFRHSLDSRVSERALREIYLKAFEMAVKEGDAKSIMSSYNPINGVQAASNFDLTTTILRKEWKYTGFVMTDWWADMNEEGQKSSKKDTTSMIISQNDVYMVGKDANENSNEDNSEEMLKEGKLQRFELIRAGINIINILLHMNCSKSCLEVTAVNVPEYVAKVIKDVGEFDSKQPINVSNMGFERGTKNNFSLKMPQEGVYKLVFDLESNGTELSQIPLTVSVNGANIETITLKGTTSLVSEVKFKVPGEMILNIQLYFGETGMTINSLHVEKI